MLPTRREPIKSRYVKLKSANVHYIMEGTGENLLLIHGYPENLSTWSNIIPLLSGNYRVYALDLKGMGKTEGFDSEMGPKAMASMIAEFMTTLQIDSAHLVGHDIGMAPVIAMALYHAQKVKSIIIGDGNFYTDSPVSWEIKWLRKPFKGKLLASGPKRIGLWWNYWRGMHRPDKEIFQKILEDSKRTTFAINGTLIFQQYAAEMAEIIADLKKINAKVLIFWGGKDKFLPLENAERLNRDIPNSKLIIIPNAGHFVTHFDPKFLSDLIKEFIAKPN